jgi:hypothetical protein
MSTIERYLAQETKDLRSAVKEERIVYELGL